MILLVQRGKPVYFSRSMPSLQSLRASDKGRCALGGSNSAVESRRRCHQTLYDSPMSDEPEEPWRMANTRRPHRLAPASSEVYAEILNKHPQSSPPSIPSGPAPSPVTITEEGVVKVLKSFPPGTAPGPSCFRFNHFKEAVF